MSDHRFSNQKSALENYFESLLEEDDSAKPHSAEAVIETKETTKSPVILLEGSSKSGLWNTLSRTAIRTFVSPG